MNTTSTTKTPLAARLRELGVPQELIPSLVRKASKTKVDTLLARYGALKKP